MLSHLVLVISGVFSVTFLSFTLFSFVFSKFDTPVSFFVTTSVCLVIFLFVFFDRKYSQLKGIYVFFPSSREQKVYQIIKDSKLLEENLIEPGRFLFAEMPLPGKAGNIVIPTQVLLLKADYVDEAYCAKTSEGEGYALLHFTDKAQLAAHVEKMCDILNIETNRLIFAK